MSFAVEFRDVCFGGFIEGFSATIEEARSVLVVTAREAVNSALLRLLTGLESPSSGSVQVLGQSVGEISTGQLYQLRQCLGIVPSSGGLVSNLKLWENITLPTLFYKGHINQEDEARALFYLERFDFSEDLMALPAHLSLYEKRVASFVRAALNNPDLMIYSNCFDDIPDSAVRAFASMAETFQKEKPSRTSIYLVSNTDSVRDMTFDTTIHVHMQVDSTARNVI